MNEAMNQIVMHISWVSSYALMPTMLVMFFSGVLFRWVIYFTVRCQYRFAAEFEKRVHKYMAHEENSLKVTSFHMLAKKTLENTYYEHFEMKRKFHRRRFDTITSITDRLFLIRQGAARLIKDTLSQTQYLKRKKLNPRFQEISKFVFGANPIFNKVLGAIPMGPFHECINLLPGLFVVGGIFGTFVGVMNGLPALAQMDVTNVDLTQKTMSSFIGQIAFAMGTSVIGIALSVIMSICNSVFSPEGLYLQTINKYTSALEFLWNDTLTNDKSHDALMLGSFAGPEDRRQLNYEIPMPKADEAEGHSETELNVMERGHSETELNVIERGHSETAPEETIASDLFASAKTKADVAIAEKPDVEVRIREIEQRLQMLDVYMKMSLEDQASGVISEPLWREKSEDWLSEKQKLEEEMQMLKVAQSGARAA